MSGNLPENNNTPRRATDRPDQGRRAPPIGATPYSRPVAPPDAGGNGGALLANLIADLHGLRTAAWAVAAIATASGPVVTVGTTGPDADTAVPGVQDGAVTADSVIAYSARGAW